MAKIRVLVVEDSLTVRRRLLEILAGDPRDRGGRRGRGRQARDRDLCQRCGPTSSRMDMMMPVMTGLAATEYIMAHCPTPILIVSASINRGELFRTYDALAAGAVDVLEKPTGPSPTAFGRRRFLATVKLVVADPRHHPSARPAGSAGASRVGAPAQPLDRPADRSRLSSSSRSARRPAGPAPSSRSCAALPAGFRLPCCSCCISTSRSARRSPTGSTGRRRAPRGLAQRRRSARRGGRSRASWRPPVGTCVARRPLAPHAAIPSAIPAGRRSTCCSSRWRRTTARGGAAAC